MTQPHIISSLDDIAERYDAFLCDVWGVLHNGERAHQAAYGALQRVRANGKPVILITNVPKPRGPIPRQLDHAGVPRDAWDAIVTSGDAIRIELAARAPGPMFKIGPDDYDRTLWEGLGLERAQLGDARFIAISGLDREDETPEDYAEMLQAAKARDLELICANPDIVVRVGDRLIWCAGAIARDYEAIGGRVVMAGKPFAPIYDLAYRELAEIRGDAIERARILCIGDGVPTDVAGANAQGLDCLFIASGMHGEALWSNGKADAEKVAAALAAENVSARYAMAALA
ncbi:MAG: TIGR01459 family HAD-type hydrolase [Phycisphaerales bacterium]|nr:TIGR01459 family HAD-type hydrolase [Hyphomonadaceae bacterium]